VEQSVRDTNGCSLIITLVNKEKAPIVFDLDDLPWQILGQRMKLTIISERTFLNPMPIMVESQAGLPVQFNSGEAKSNEVNLDLDYPGLHAALLNQDVDIIWDYTPRPRGTNSYLPIVGHLRLPRLRATADSW